MGPGGMTIDRRAQEKWAPGIPVAPCWIYQKDDKNRGIWFLDEWNSGDAVSSKCVDLAKPVTYPGDELTWWLPKAIRFLSCLGC